MTATSLGPATDSRSTLSSFPLLAVTRFVVIGLVSANAAE
jgi:hypothetical protein